MGSIYTGSMNENFEGRSGYDRIIDEFKMYLSIDVLFWSRICWSPDSLVSTGSAFEIFSTELLSGFGSRRAHLTSALSFSRQSIFYLLSNKHTAFNFSVVFVGIKKKKIKKMN